MLALGLYIPPYLATWFKQAAALIEFPKLSGPMPIWHGTVNEAKFYSLCEQARHDGGRLVALWGRDEQMRGASYALHVSLVTTTGMLCLTLPISATAQLTRISVISPVPTAPA